MTVGRKILTGFLACALVLIGVAIFSYKNGEKFAVSKAWVDHTHQVLYEFEEILIYNIDAESSARGSIITGDDIYLESFLYARIKAIEHLNTNNVYNY